MKPGPELDALVAEKVMGWERAQARCRECSSLAERWIWKKNGQYVADASGECRYSPSSSIREAWEVVEHMSKTTKEYWTIEYFSTGALVVFDYEGGRDLPWVAGEHRASEDTAPHAICLAALKAVDEP